MCPHHTLVSRAESHRKLSRRWFGTMRPHRFVSGAGWCTQPHPSICLESCIIPMVCPHCPSWSTKFYPAPEDPVHVGKWVKTQFGVKSSITAIYMTHAVINDNCHVRWTRCFLHEINLIAVVQLLHNYTMATDKTFFNPSSHHVPITFKHFQILARLGRAPVGTPSFWYFCIA